MTVRTIPRKCYVCGAPFEAEWIPMQESYRGAKSMRMYVPTQVQTWCPRGHKLVVGVATAETLDLTSRGRRR